MGGRTSEQVEERNDKIVGWEGDWGKCPFEGVL